MPLALYRKYRPILFKDLIGQEIIVKILQEAVRRDRLSHAYLLSGPRGTGKTSTARLIAKIANCEEHNKESEYKKRGEPCNKCNACVSVQNGNSLDIVEIDAASNRGIDEIRDLKEHARIAPVILRHKVYIIDEAHMLTKEASNALLKTLEEPPEYLIIILATTEFEKIPVTISSRTQVFRFRRVAMSEIVKKLTEISKKENINIKDDAIELIATSAEGSIRDAESLLDQMASMAENEITIKIIQDTLGVVGFETISKCSNALLSYDTENALMLIRSAHNEGVNIVELTKDIIRYLRHTAVLSYSPNMKDKMKNELPKNQIDQIEKHAKIFTEKHIELIKSLITAYSQMRYSEFPIIPLEMAIMSNKNQTTSAS